MLQLTWHDLSLKIMCWYNLKFQDNGGNGAVAVAASLQRDINWISSGALIHSDTAAAQN